LRSKVGNLIFKILREKTLNRLKKEGYEVLENARLEGGTYINFIGSKDSKKLGVEILIRPTKRTVNEKLKIYKEYRKSIDEIIFAVPSHSSYKPQENCWEFDIITELKKGET